MSTNCAENIHGSSYDYNRIRTLRGVAKILFLDNQIRQHILQERKSWKGRGKDLYSQVDPKP